MAPHLRTLRDCAAARAPHAVSSASAVLLAVTIAAVTIACGSSADLVTGPSETKCQVALEAPPSTVDPGGATIGIAVRTQAECTWTASSTATWVASLTPASGQGNGEVRVQVSANPLPSSRQAEVIVNNSRASLQQAAAACRFEVTPTTGIVPATSTSGTVNVATLAGCSWSAVSNAEWIQIAPGGSRVGSGDVSFTVTANAGPGRSGQLTIAGVTVTVTQEAALVAPTPPPPGPAPTPTPTPTPTPPPSPTPTCTNDITPSAITIAAAGGTQRVAVAALPGCGWTAASSVSWITIVSGAAGVGPGAVDLLIAPNSGGARTATLTIAGRQVTVAQAAAAAPEPPPTPTPPPPTPPPPSPPPPTPTCTYAVAPADASIAASGGAGSPITVTTATGCPWTAAATVTWLAITTGAAGNGAGTVTFTAESNTGSQRTGTLTVAGHTVTVTQAAAAIPCTYQVAPSQQTIAAVGGAGSPFTVTAGSGCPWTATTAAGWITITSQPNQTGSGSVTFTAAANPGAEREATLTIAGQTVTVSQAAVTPTTPPTCVSSLSPTGDTVGLAGATGRSLMVRAPNSCSWTAVASAPWLTITSGASGSGNGKVDYAVAPLSTGSRTATISIGGQTFTVTQSGPTP